MNQYERRGKSSTIFIFAPKLYVSGIAATVVTVFFLSNPSVLKCSVGKMLPIPRKASDLFQLPFMYKISTAQTAQIVVVPNSVPESHQRFHYFT